MEAVAAFCRRWEMLPRGGLVLCAVSGGRDSMALLHYLRVRREAEGFALAAAHFNHCLRAGADRDEAFVRAVCRDWGISLAVGREDVGAFARETGRSLEDAARTLRYRFLEEEADRLGAARIAVAHHRRDNAETVLLHLLRGSGLRGLGGMAPVRGRIVRPLLDTDRADIEAYIRENSVPYVEDETNTDTRYTRNRLRLEVLPLLEEIAPGCGDRMAHMAELLRAEETYLEDRTQALLPPEDGGAAVTLAAPVLLGQEEAIRRRLVRSMARRLGVELTAAQTEAVLDLGTGGCLDLPGGLRAFRERHRLTIRRVPPLPPPLPLRPGTQRWGPWTVLVETEPGEGHSREEPLTLALSAETAGEGLAIGSWDGTGRLAVENGSRTIKRLFADRGVPVDRREEHPVLYAGGRPVAVFGVAVDRDHRPRPGAARVRITLEETAETETREKER